MPLYFPLFLFVIAIGYYRKIILQMIVILNLSFIYLTVNQVSEMYSGNQLNYLPPIIKENFEIFQLDFTANITYPYQFISFSLYNLLI